MHTLYLLRYPLEVLSSALFTSQESGFLTIKIEKAFATPVSECAEIFSSTEPDQFRPYDRLSYDGLLNVICEGNPILVF